jgi:prolyl-tRNA synthetase
MKDGQVDAMKKAGGELFEGLRSSHADLVFRLDDRDQYKPGWKYAEWEQRGVPVRIEIGPRDVEKKQVVLVRRDTGEKEFVSRDAVDERLPRLLEEIQQSLFDRALAFRQANTHHVDDYEVFRRDIEEKGGFFLAHWDGTAETEARVKEETKATIRVIPTDDSAEAGTCMVTGKPSPRRVVWARAY